MKPDNRNKTKIWVQGLFAAAITGAANSVALVAANAAFDIFKDRNSLLTAIATSTLVSVAAYLKQSPVPYYDFEGGTVESPDSPPAPAPLPPRPTGAATKWPSWLIFAGLLTLPGLTGCATSQLHSSAQTAAQIQPFLRPASAAIGIGVLMAEKTPANKAKVAKWLDTSAVAIRALASETPPTAEELSHAMTQLAPSTPVSNLDQVVVSLVSLYQSARGQFGDDTATILKALDSLALGLQDAAKPYLPAPTAP